MAPTANNAAGLFPTIAPRRTPTPSSTPSPVKKTHARQVADTSALPEGAPIANAEVAGLAALALAFVLAVTRLSIRRRPAPRPDLAAADGPAAGTDEPANEPDSDSSQSSEAGQPGTDPEASNDGDSGME